MDETKPTSFRLSDRAKELLSKIAEHDKRSMTATLEFFIEREAKAKGLDIPQEPT